MRPFSSPKNTSDTQRTFADAAEAWLLRARDPHADTAVLDAVQRRQDPSQTRVAPTNGVHTIPDMSRRPSPARPVQLRKIRGEQPISAWFLPTDRPSLIGRSGKQDSSLDIDLWPDMGISRRHALIWFDGDTWRLEDLCSTNGTFIAEMNIRGQRAMRLELGMIVRLGRTVLTLATCTPKGQDGAGPREAASPVLPARHPSSS